MSYDVLVENLRQAAAQMRSTTQPLSGYDFHSTNVTGESFGHVELAEWFEAVADQCDKAGKALRSGAEALAGQLEYAADTYENDRRRRRQRVPDSAVRQRLRDHAVTAPSSMQLGETKDPKKLIPGEVGHVRANVTELDDENSRITGMHQSFGAISTPGLVRRPGPRGVRDQARGRAEEVERVRGPAGGGELGARHLRRGAVDRPVPRAGRHRQVGGGRAGHGRRGDGVQRRGQALQRGLGRTVLPVRAAAAPPGTARSVPRPRPGPARRGRADPGGRPQGARRGRAAGPRGARRARGRQDGGQRRLVRRERRGARPQVQLEVLGGHLRQREAG